MSEIFLKAKGSSQGIAIGEMALIDADHPPQQRRLKAHEIPYELKRLSRAFAKAIQKLKRAHHPIFESQQILLQDRSVQKQVEAKILQKRVNAEWALNQIAKAHADLHDPLTKVLGQLLLRNPLENLKFPKNKKVILAANTLTPAAVANLAHHHIQGVILASGSENSHALILARSLNLPALCGFARDDFLKLKENCPVILDGFEKNLLLNPSAGALKKYRELARKQSLLEALLLEEVRKPAATRDGVAIHVEANAELKEEIPNILKYGAEGIGLFRTEALFWNPDRPPTFEEQTKIYEALLTAMKERPVAIRTMDVSGEEWLRREEPNPALGLRGLRLGLQESALLKTQLQAILKASIKGNAKILLPMVTSLEELEIFLEFLDHAKQELRRKKIPFRADIPVGVTLEIPAAALIADILATRADFLTIGTNDLMQYTLAVDRDNEEVSHLYSPFHPALWRLLKQIIDAAARAQKPLLLCGELASNPLFLPLLIGLGLRNFSMAPHAIPKAKKSIRSLSAQNSSKMAARLLKLHHSQAIEKALKGFSLELDTR